MQEQDEVDKGGISLMGVKHEERTREYTNLNDSQSLERNQNKQLSQNASVGSGIHIGSPLRASTDKIHTYSKRRFTSMGNAPKEYNETTGATNASIKINNQ
jgi:hypothetical protein